MQNNLKTCPFCSEKIQDSAVKCKHCGEWLNKKPSFIKKEISIFLYSLRYIIPCLLGFLFSSMFDDYNYIYVRDASLSSNYLSMFNKFVFISGVLMSIVSGFMNHKKESYIDGKFHVNISTETSIFLGIISTFLFYFLTLNLKGEDLYINIYIILVPITLNLSYIMSNILFKDFNLKKHIINGFFNTIISLFIINKQNSSNISIYDTSDLGLSIYKKDWASFIYSAIIIPITIIVPYSLSRIRYSYKK